MRERNKRKVIIFSLLATLSIVTVAYAAIATSLSITGNVVRRGGL